MAFPTDTVLTANSALYLQKSIGQRTPPTATVTTSGIVASGATTIPITPVVSPTGLLLTAGQVVIQQGTSLTFNSTTPTTIILAQDIKVGDTAAIPVAPTTNAMQSGNTATSIGALRLLGAEDLSFSLTDKTVPTRSFENGLWMDERKVTLGGEIAIKGFYRVGDPCFTQIILPLATSADECYFKSIYPDKTYRQGYALLQGYKEENQLDNIRRYSFNLKAVGPVTFGTDI
jgi:hypothetical protein